MSSYKDALPMPPMALLLEKFTLDATNGLLIRKTSYKQFKAGDVAGYNRNGYWVVKLEGKSYLVHRLIYYMVTGVDPGVLMVDHEDGNTLNNAFANLRLATIKENGRNRAGLLSNNTSGHRGVSYNAKSDRWIVYVYVDGKSIQRWRKTKEEAVQCAVELRAKHYGEFAGVAA